MKTVQLAQFQTPEATIRATPEFEREVTAEQALFLHRNLPVLVTSTFLGGVFTVYVLWGALEPSALTAWTAFLFVLTLVRLARWRSFSATALTVEPRMTAAWLREVHVGAVASGASWGVLALAVMIYADAGLRATMLLAGVFITVASCFSYGARFSVFLAFFLPALLPEVPALLLRADRMDKGLAGGLSVFILVMLASGWRFNALFVRSLLLRFRNAALVEQLRRERDTAELANVSKSRALAATGHDLRQPVHAIGLSVAMLRRIGGKSAELEAVAKHLQESTGTLWRLLDTLADISRLDAKLVTVKPVEFDLNDELLQAVSLMRPAGEARGLEMRLVETSLRVRADPKIVATVLLNLLSNAVRYTIAGRILIGCRRRGAKVEIWVCDTGIGFAPDEVGTVFSEFIRGRYVDGVQSEGLGLGLAIVRQSLQLLDEAVRIVATSPRGSIIGFTLPRRLPE